MLRLADKWVWDFWFAREGDDFHIFYLQASNTLPEERLRHWHVSVGHAVSKDLRQWEILPDALHPSPEADPEPFDSYTTWTGSIIKRQDQWYMFYTGSRRSEAGLVQRIGLATSTDLIHWQKHHNNPVMVADATWYELLDLNAWHDHAWRDPYVFQHPERGDYHAFITTRAKHGPPDARGVIAHTRSDDLLTWEILPPVTQPGEFGHLEVPQFVMIGEHCYLLFSCPHRFYSNTRKNRLGDRAVTGTHYLAADNPLGPYQEITENFLVGNRIGSYYGGKLIQDHHGQWQFLAFKNFSPDWRFIGEITDPMPVSIGPDGRLSVAIK